MTVCSAENCTRDARARGLCGLHYQRLTKGVGGSAKRPGAVCSVAGCNRPHSSRGYCRKHHTRWLRHGDANHTAAWYGAAKRFYNDVVLTRAMDDPPCLIWPFHRNKDGYATWDDWTDVEGTSLVARRVCEARHGPPPSPASEAAHSCGNGHLGCVSRGHVRWASRAENARDTIRHGTSTRGTRNPHAKLDDSAVRVIRALRGVQTQADIAMQYGVSRELISKIQRRKVWAWLD